MANRSYLYALSGSAENGIKAVGECNYALPLLFCILCSSNPERAGSVIWESDAAIAADFSHGVKLADDFLKKLLADNIHVEGRPVITEAGYQGFQHFFAKLKGCEHFVLECLELYEMDSGDPDDFPALVQKDIDRIGLARESVKSFFATSKLDSFLKEELQQDIDYNCGVDYLSDILYYSFAAKDDNIEEKLTSAELTPVSAKKENESGLWDEIRGWAGFVLRIAIIPPFGIFLGLYALIKGVPGARAEGVVALILGTALTVLYVWLFTSLWGMF